MTTTKTYTKSTLYLYLYLYLYVYLTRCVTHNTVVSVLLHRRAQEYNIHGLGSKENKNKILDDITMNASEDICFFPLLFLLLYYVRNE